MRRLFLALALVAVGTIAGAWGLGSIWKFEFSTPLVLPPVNSVNPVLHSICDETTGDRILIVAKHSPTRSNSEAATVQAMAVIPRGCWDQHR